MNQQRPRGTQDLFGKKSATYRRLEQYLRTVAGFYGYGEIITPLFENKELFLRSVGQATEIAQKELYEFTDRGERQMALRPEGTAGAVRALIENNLMANADLPLKLFYFGPMYRYERPQAGRYREFWQFGVESFGIKNEQADIETIVLAFQILTQAARLKKFALKINYLGGVDVKEAWSKSLTAYFEKNLAALSEESIKRVRTNPLRILDDKNDSKLKVVKAAPKLTEFLSQEALASFKSVCDALDGLKIDYEVDTALVRGLDYYTGTVFEFVCTGSNSGSQDTLIGGGRYDELVESLGGDPTPAVGFGLGVERIALAMEAEKIDITEPDELDAYLVCVSKSAHQLAINIATNLRMNGLKVEFDMLSRKIGAQFKSVARKNARHAVVIGDSELQAETFTVKDQKTGKEHKVRADELVAHLTNRG